MNVEVHAQIIESDDRKLVLGIFRDITTRKKAEKALKEVRAQLEKKVEERTLEFIEANSKLQSEIREREKAEKQITKIPRNTKKNLQKKHQQN